MSKIVLYKSVKNIVLAKVFVKIKPNSPIRLSPVPIER